MLDFFYISIRYCFVYFFIFTFLLLDMVVFSTPMMSIEIPFFLMVVYYWGIYRPMLMSPIFVFFAALWIDIISQFPIGLTPFVLLMVQYFISQQRLFLIGQPFVVIWLAYAFISVIALFLQWFIFGLMNMQWVAFDQVIYVISAGIFIFPLISALMYLMHKVLPAYVDSYSSGQV